MYPVSAWLSRPQQRSGTIGFAAHRKGRLRVYFTAFLDWGGILVLENLHINVRGLGDLSAALSVFCRSRHIIHLLVHGHLLRALILLAHHDLFHLFFLPLFLIQIRVSSTFN